MALTPEARKLLEGSDAAMIGSVAVKSKQANGANSDLHQTPGDPYAIYRDGFVPVGDEGFRAIAQREIAAKQKTEIGIAAHDEVKPATHEADSSVVIQAVLSGVLVAVLLIFPIWKTFKRAGLRPIASLWLFVPFLGCAMVMGILALSDWPAEKRTG